MKIAIRDYKDFKQLCMLWTLSHKFFSGWIWKFFIFFSLSICVYFIDWPTYTLLKAEELIWLSVNISTLKIKSERDLYNYFEINCHVTFKFQMTMLVILLKHVHVTHVTTIQFQQVSFSLVLPANRKLKCNQYMMMNRWYKRVNYIFRCKRES